MRDPSKGAAEGKIKVSSKSKDPELSNMLKHQINTTLKPTSKQYSLTNNLINYQEYKVRVFYGGNYYSHVLCAVIPLSLVGVHIRFERIF
jgi:hypothetical protein